MTAVTATPGRYPPSKEFAEETLSSTFADWRETFEPERVHVIGILRGEGIGPEVVAVAEDLLHLLLQHTERRFEIRVGGLIGSAAQRVHGQNLTEEVIGFSQQVFAQHGALFCGPGGGRFVYDMRVRFDLYCKITPLRPMRALRESGVVRPDHLHDIDILAVRENVGGLYQGVWSESVDQDGRKVTSQSFSYSEQQVDRILRVALRLAAARRGRLAIVLKPGGVPTISRLWSERVQVLNQDYDVEVQELEIDNAVYQLIANPRQFDVMVSPNMFGDVLADCGSLLLGSRGMSYSGNFGGQGVAVYQTGHGAAKDLAGSDSANPIGQLFALAMLLRESFNWSAAAALLLQSIEQTLDAGFRTRDITAPGCTVLGTRAMGEEIKLRLALLLNHRVI